MKDRTSLMHNDEKCGVGHMTYALRLPLTWTTKNVGVQYIEQTEGCVSIIIPIFLKSLQCSRFTFIFHYHSLSPQQHFWFAGLSLFMGTVNILVLVHQHHWRFLNWFWDGIHFIVSIYDILASSVAYVASRATFKAIIRRSVGSDRQTRLMSWAVDMCPFTASTCCCSVISCVYWCLIQPICCFEFLFVHLFSLTVSVILNVCLELNITLFHFLRASVGHFPKNLKSWL